MPSDESVMYGPMSEPTIPPPSGAKCEACGCWYAAEIVVGINVVNGHLWLCRKCLDEINRKSPLLHAAETSLATAHAERDAALEAARKYRERIEDMQAVLESVNALAREFGFGQGELNDDLADCLRKAFRRENDTVMGRR